MANEARGRESQLKEILLERLSRLAEGARSAPETIEEKQLKSKRIEEESGEGGTLIKGFRELKHLGQWTRSAIFATTGVGALAGLAVFSSIFRERTWIAIFEVEIALR